MSHAYFLYDLQRSRYFLPVPVPVHSQLVVSFSGLLSAISTIVHYIPLPEDPLLVWLLRICFFVDVAGIVFHSILFIISTILTCGAIADIPSLLVPWLGWSPFLITFILVQMIMVIVEAPDLALPIISFCFMVFLFIIYASLVITAHYSEMNSSTIQLRLFNLGSGELPRIVEMRSRFSRNRDAAVAEGVPSTHPTQEESDRILTNRVDIRQRLADAYSKLVRASRTPSNQNLQTGPTRY